MPNTKRRFISRYLCINIDGRETYTENISTDGEMKKYVPLLKKRLAIAAKAMPQAKFTGHIEQQWREESGGRTTHRFQQLYPEADTIHNYEY